MDKIRMGVIGNGMIVPLVCDNFIRTQQVSVTCVYARSPEKAGEVASRYDARPFSDMDSFFTEGDFDYVYIALPNALHYSTAKKALSYGKGVIVEKPFCVGSDHAMELVDLARKKNLLLVDATPTFFLPNLKYLRSAVGRIGRIRLCMSNYSQYSSRFDRFLKGDRAPVFQSDLAGGALMDLNYYNVYLNVLLFGEPENVTYHPNMMEDLDTSGIAILSYDGFQSSCMGAKDTWGENFFQVEGFEGFVNVPKGSNGLVRIDLERKDLKESFDEQDNPDRWYYDALGISKLIREFECGEMTDLYENQDVMLGTIRTIEKARLSCGLAFSDR